MANFVISEVFEHGSVNLDHIINVKQVVNKESIEDIYQIKFKDILGEIDIWEYTDYKIFKKDLDKIASVFKHCLNKK